jgi:hypothetical protein
MAFNCGLRSSRSQGRAPRIGGRAAPGTASGAKRRGTKLERAAANSFFSERVSMELGRQRSQSGKGVAFAEEFEESYKGGVFIVGLPVSQIVQSAWPVAITQFSIRQAREVGSNV